jgi:hypothetical protein
LIDRRGFLGGCLAAALAPAALARVASAEGARSEASPRGAQRGEAERSGRPQSQELEDALAKSGLVYISPLLADGRESTCHGEVWFAWLDGSVVIITGRDRWKARAVARGLDGARIWVGDHGPWKRLGVVENEAFRSAPSFVARAETVKDTTLLDRLLAEFERKYPDEIGQWRDKMRSGYADGSRVLVRYTPKT